MVIRAGGVKLNGGVWSITPGLSPLAVIRGVTLSPNTAQANSATGTVVGALTIQSTGVALTGASITISDPAGRFQLVGNNLEFLSGSVGAGTYTVPVIVTATNAVAYSGNVAITLTSATAALTIAAPKFATQNVAKTFTGTMPTGTTFSNLQYSLDNSSWSSLPSGAASSGTTFSFPLTFASLSNALQVFVRDSTHAGTVATTGQFSCNSAPAYTTTPISGTVPSSIRLGLMAHGATLSSLHHTSAPGFAKGQFNPATQRLLGQIGAGSPFEIYVDGVKTWSDGTVRTCRVSAPITSTFTNGVETVINVTIDNNLRATGTLTTPAALVAAHDWHVKHYGGQCNSDVFTVSLRDIVNNFSRDTWGMNPLGGWDVFANNPGELGVHGWSYWKRADGNYDAWRKTEIWVSQRLDGTFEFLAQVKQSNYDIPHPSATLNTSAQHSLVCFHELYQDTTLVGAWGGTNDSTTSLSSGTHGAITIPASNFNVSTNTVSGLSPAFGTPVLFAPASGGSLPSGLTAGTPYYVNNGSIWTNRADMSGATGGVAALTFGSAGSGNIVATPAFGTYNGSSLILAAPNGYPYLIGGTRTQVTTAWDEVYMSKWATLFPAYAQPTDTTFQLTRYTSSQITDWGGFSSFTPNMPTIGFWLNTTGDNPGDPRIGYLAMRNVVSHLVPHDANYDLTARVEALGWGDYAYWWDDVSAGRVLNFGAATLPNMGPPRPNSGFSYNGGDVSVGNGSGADASGYYDGYSGCLLTASHMPAPWVVPYHHTGHPIYPDMGLHQAVTSGLLADGSQCIKTLGSVTYTGLMGTSASEQARGFAWTMRCWDFVEQFLPSSRPEAAYVQTQMDVNERYWRDYVDAFQAVNPAWFNLGLIIPDTHYYGDVRCQPYMHAMAYCVMGQLAAHRERDYSNFLSAAGNLVVNLFDDAGPYPASVGSWMGYDAVGYYWAIDNPAFASVSAMAAVNAPYDNANGGANIGSYPYPATGLPSSTSGNAQYYTNGGFPWGTGGDYPMLFRCGLATTAGLGVVSFNGGQAARAHNEWVARMTTSPCTGIKFSAVGGAGSLGNTGPHMFPSWAIVPVYYP